MKSLRTLQDAVSLDSSEMNTAFSQLPPLYTAMCMSGRLAEEAHRTCVVPPTSRRKTAALLPGCTCMLFEAGREERCVLRK